jgi:hypothetical protein
MKLNRLFAIHGWVSIMIGLAFLLGPAVALEWLFARPAPAQTVEIVSHPAAFLLALGVILIAAQDFQEAESRRALAIGVLVITAGAALITVLELVAGALQLMAWGAFGFFSLLALGYAYFLFVAKKA